MVCSGYMVVTQCYGQLQVDKCSDPFRVHGVCHMLLRPVGPVTGAWACASACRDFERFHCLKQGSTRTAVKSRSLAWDYAPAGEARLQWNRGGSKPMWRIHGSGRVQLSTLSAFPRPSVLILGTDGYGILGYGYISLSIILSSHAVCVPVYGGSSEVMK